MCYFQFNTIKFSKNVQPFSDASKSLKIFRRRSEGAAEGGCGGNSAVPERLSPAACSVRSRSQQKSFLFLLEEKISRAQIKKCKENFFAGWRALASGGGANQPFRSKKVRAKCIIIAQYRKQLFVNIEKRMSLTHPFFVVPQN